MKKIILITFIFLNMSLYALEQDTIKEQMQINITNVTSILQEKDINKEEKALKVFNMLDKIFDYKLMSRISLGRAYKKLENSQKSDFKVAFENKLKNSYMDKLSLYTDQITEVKELKQVKKNRIILYTDLVGDDTVYAINYKFYKNKKNDWLIYDVELLGVSILQTYRKQFKEYLKSHTISELIQNM